MSPEPTEPADVERDFASFVRSLEDGHLHATLSEDLRGLVEALSEHVMNFGGKPAGELNVKFKFKLDGGTVEVATEIKVTKPKEPHGRSIFWPTGTGHLTKQNPRQRHLPFSDAALGGDRTIRTV